MQLSRRIKQAACAALASAVLLSGCSTPAVAATVDGKPYSTGVYLAYLYQMYVQTFESNYTLYMLQYYGQDPWDQTMTYGEGDDAQELSLEDYIIQITKDTIIRQKALENKIAEYGLTPDEEAAQDIESQLAQVSNDDILQMGFNKESYAEMLRAYGLNEQTLFYGLYDNGGERAMSDEEIRTYFEENYLSYKIIEVSLTDSSGSDMDEDEIAEVREELEGYLDMYNENGDFDKVIEQYEADQQESTTGSDGDSGSETTTGDGTTTTGGTTADGTTTGTEDGGTTTEPTTAPTDSGEESGDGESTDEEEETDPNLHNIDANTYGDEAFTDAVKSVAVGEAEIVEYKKGNTTNTMALVLRLDPEEVNEPNEDGETYFEQNRQAIIYGAKYEEFNDEITEYANSLDAEFDEGVVRKCTPRQLEEDMSR